EKIAVLESTSAVKTAGSAEMREYLDTPLPAEVRAIADADFAPLLSASLAGPREAVTTAATKRDVERSQALAAAQADAEKASLDATAEQHNLIAEGRRQIEAEKVSGARESQEKLAGFDLRVQQLHEAKQGEIQTRINTDQAR